MNLVTLDALRSRIGRLRATVQTNSHVGFEQSRVLDDDGHTHHFKFAGVKSPEQLEGELLSLFVWVWSLKDHFKEAFRRKGCDPKEVESLVDQSLALQLVADVANRAKHGEVKRSRSGKFVELVDVGWSIPKAAVAKLSVGAFEVHTVVAKPELVSLHAHIQSSDGLKADAFTVLEEALKFWEGVYAEVGRA